MIRALINAVRDMRIRRHHARAHQHGTATLAAQIDRDWESAGRHMQRMHEEQAKRDRLLQLHRPRVCCDHNCREGRDCPLRA